MVARDYALDKRDDVYSPASRQHALRLLPVLFLSAASMEMELEHNKGKPVIGALDVKDAFLQVPQENLCGLLQPLENTKFCAIYQANASGQKPGMSA